MKITIVTASEGKGLELANKFKEYFASQNVDSEVLNVVELELPLYTSRSEKTHDPAQVVESFNSSLEANGFVFIAPEYNGGTPPSLSNFLAWVSRSTKNWRERFTNRPAVIATHSGGGQNILHVMRLQLSYIGMHVIGRQILTNPNKILTESELKAVCDELIRLA